MGKAPAKKAAAPGKGRPRGAKGGRGAAAAEQTEGLFAGGALLSPTNKLLLLLVVIALIPFSLPTVIFLFFGMLPTIAAALAPKSIGRNAWISVGGLNFAGLAHWLFALWFGHHTMQYAFSLLLGITPVLVAYAGAGLGWGIYLAMPPVVNAFMSVQSARRLVVLVANQKKLVEQWGDGVISREPVKDKDETPDGAAPPAPAPAPAGAGAKPAKAG